MVAADQLHGQPVADAAGGETERRTECLVEEPPEHDGHQAQRRLEDDPAEHEQSGTQVVVGPPQIDRQLRRDDVTLVGSEQP